MKDQHYAAKNPARTKRLDWCYEWVSVPRPDHKCGPYWVHLANYASPYIVLVMGADQDHPGYEFSHPNLARSRDKVFEYKHSAPNGHKWWTLKQGREHVFIVPRERVLLRLVEGYSYPEFQIGEYVIGLNTSGGTGPGRHAWTDYITDVVHTFTCLPVTLMKAVAEAAVRGTYLEPFKFFDELRDEWRAAHAQDWQSRSAVGDWHEDVPKGYVLVWACIGGHDNPDPKAEVRQFLVPAARYDHAQPYGYAIQPDDIPYTPVTHDAAALAC
jgi:hypothetical protein